MKWSPTSIFDRRAYSPENLSSVIQKEFCNTIGGIADMAALAGDLTRSRMTLAV
jgi:hypothetical protein